MADQELVTVTIDGMQIAVPKGTSIIEAAKQAGVLVPALLLPSVAAVAGGVPDVPGRGGEGAQAGAGLRHGGGRGAGGAREQSSSAQEGARGRARAPADQSPARLPDLRPGRRVRAAGLHVPGGPGRAPGTRSTPSATTRSRTSGPTSSTSPTAASSAPAACASWRTWPTTPVLNVSERGDRAYIGIAEEQRLDHPWAGNVVDLCPVGLAPLEGLPAQGARLGPRQDAPASAPAAPRAATSSSTPATTSWCGSGRGRTSR